MAKAIDCLFQFGVVERINLQLARSVLTAYYCLLLRFINNTVDLEEIKLNEIMRNQKNNKIRNVVVLPNWWCSSFCCDDDNPIFSTHAIIINSFFTF